jgi:mRNA-degrading endonuclease toxin of MazEF toxin-antitoxin module
VSVRRGEIFQNSTPGAQAPSLLVLSEDDWNSTIPDGVAVPMFDRGPEQAESLMLVHITGTLFADCTKVQTVVEGHWGQWEASCDRSALTRVEDGVRAFLVTRQLKEKRPPAPARTPSRARGWWPHQGAVRYADPPINGVRKMHGVLSDDAWNEIGSSWTTVRLTSQSKGWRARWEVPVTGGFVVSGDLFATPRGALDQSPPKPPRPDRLTLDEMAQIADRIEVVLGL